MCFVQKNSYLVLLSHIILHCMHRCRFYFRDFLPSISGSPSSMRIQIRIQEAFDSDLNPTYLYVSRWNLFNPEFS